MKTIVYTHQAAKELDAIRLDDREAIVAGLVSYAADGRGDVKKLTNRGGVRLRIGSYRAIFDESENKIVVIAVGRRQTTTYRRI